MMVLSFCKSMKICRVHQEFSTIISRKTNLHVLQESEGGRGMGDIVFVASENEDGRSVKTHMKKIQ